MFIMNFLYILFLIGFIVLVIVCIPLQLFLFNFPKALYYLSIDLYHYFKYKKYDYAPIGSIDCYAGLFGKGKTLSAVHYVTNYYKRYNNKQIYDEFSNSWVTQYVQVLSNVVLSIPYKDFKSLSQIVDLSETVMDFNKEHSCRLVTIVLGDEFSQQLNSRNFKSNLDSASLGALLQMRHFNMSLVYTSQRFSFTDVLLRSVTSNVIECKKLWRLQCHNYYDAWDLEQAGSSLKLQPIKRTGFFVTNKDYAAYDTRFVVDQLIKDYRDGSLLSEETILALRASGLPDPSNSKHLKKRFRSK